MTNMVETAVVGGGPAGLATALALSAAGVETALVAPPHRPTAGPADDRRTAALFTGSMEMLESLGLRQALEAGSEAIHGIRLIDDTDSLLRAPEVTFTASEAGLRTFGYNIPNALLVEVMTAAIKAPGSGIKVIETAGVTSVEPKSDSVRLSLAEGGVLSARLVAGAEGRNSVCRTGAGIGTRTWSYPQSALVCSFTHSRPHEGISTEFHRRTGPCTTVPLPGLASSLVWVEAPEAAQRLAALDTGSFRVLLERQLKGLLGTVGEIGPRSAYPLSGLTAEVFGLRRIALIGETAHVIPPIGAQGLNLSLRDGATLADAVADAMREGRDIGGEATLNAYSSARAPDIGGRIWTIDLLNRSLLSELLPIHLARGLGLLALKTIGPLRRLLVNEGLQPSYAIPDLMQPGGRERLKTRRQGTVSRTAALSA